MLKSCLFQWVFFPALAGRLYLWRKRFHWANVIFAAYFIPRGHDTHFLRLLLFLVGMICPLMQEHQGHSQDFWRGGGGGGGVTDRDTIRGLPAIYGLYRCSPSYISGLCRIIAAWRLILTKDKSRWRKYFTKNQILKSGLFKNGFYGQDIVMAFSPPEYCRLFAQKKAYQGEVTCTPGPPLATPLSISFDLFWNAVLFIAVE